MLRERSQTRIHRGRFVMVSTSLSTIIVFSLFFLSSFFFSGFFAGRFGGGVLVVRPC